jgi:hypothetical protein
MIPYLGEKIQKLSDVANLYPEFFNLKDLRRKEVLNFRKQELEKLKKHWGTSKTTMELQDLALAKGYYSFLWVIDNATKTACSWGWQATDTHLLLNRMKQAGVNPWQISDVVGDFLSNMKGHGFVERTGKYGPFLVYDPEGKKKSVSNKKISVVIYEGEDKELNEAPDEDDFNDVGAAPGEVYF